MTRKVGRPRVPDADRIASRWQYWLPWATMEARRTAGKVSFADLLLCMKDTHADICRQLLSLGLRWPSIIKWKLDEPDHPDRPTVVAAALERRRTRLGHTKHAVDQRYRKNNITTEDTHAD